MFLKFFFVRYVIRIKSSFWKLKFTFNLLHPASSIYYVPPVNVTTRIEVHQRYIAAGKYNYFIIVDGVKISSNVNNYVRQFYNVQVYASDGHSPCQAFIKNLVLTNFL